MSRRRSTPSADVSSVAWTPRRKGNGSAAGGVKSYTATAGTSRNSRARSLKLRISNARVSSSSSPSKFVGKQVADNGIPPERVASQIADAAATGKPKARYLLPASSKVLVGLMTRLPDRSADRAKLFAGR